MAEPTADVRDRVLAVFLPRYNALHSTSFRADSVTEIRNHIADWEVASDDGRSLQVQHVRAESGDERERRARAFLDDCRSAIERDLAEMGHGGHYIQFRLLELPGSKGKQTAKARLCEATQFAIQRTATPQTMSAKLLHDTEDARFIDGLLRPAFSQLRVYGLRDLTLPNDVTWSFGCGGKGVVRTEVRVLATIRKKIESYGPASGVVLLVHCDNSDYDDGVLARIKTGLIETRPSFDEIWVAQYHPMDARADRLWPSTAEPSAQ